MNRQNRDYNDRYDNGYDYGRNTGYDRDDSRYHNARNLTNEFERNYRDERSDWRDDNDNYSRRNISYHETNDPENLYERRMQDQGHFRWYSDVDNENRDLVRRFSGGLHSDRDNRDRYSRRDSNHNRERNRYSNYQDDYRSYQNIDDSNRYNDRYRSSNIEQGNMRQGYGISGYEGTSDRYNTLNSDRNREGDNQNYYGRNQQSNYGSDRFNNGMGESFPGSNRGVPDATYGHGNYSQSEGTGMGSTYGGRNYGGGTGYTSGHRGGSFGNQNYGTSSGNYGGYGSTGSGSYGGRSGYGRDATSHNSDRGTSELGGL